MIIRSAVISDADEIADLTGKLGYAVDREKVRGRLSRLLDRSDQIIVVASLEEHLIGWMHARTLLTLEAGFRVEIVGLAVAERYRRRGAGGALIRRAEKWAGDLGADAIVALTSMKRVEGNAFYATFGFAAAETQAVHLKPLPKMPEGPA